MTAQVAVLLGTARPNFLVLTPLSVLLGIAVAYAGGAATLQYGWALLALIGAALAHASVNMLNEYEDFRSGLDFRTCRTPFSGGSGTLVSKPHGAPSALAGGIATLAGTILIGCVLAYYRGWGLLPLGLLGVLTVAVYSRQIVRSPLASLVAPGLGFGPLMVLGTAYVVTGHLSISALAASLVPFFLVNGLLLLNQFPDVEADKQVGRRNLPIVLGRPYSALIFALLTAAAFLTVMAGIVSGIFPTHATIALLPALGAPVLVRQVYRHADDTERLTPLLGWNVVMTLATPLLLAIGILAT